MASYFHKVASAFPLVTYPPLTITAPLSAKDTSEPVLWVHPAQEEESPNLSQDVECLKYQAYLALTLTGLRMKIRTDVDEQGAMNGKLPNLYANGKLMERHDIFGWAAEERGQPEEPEWDGYRDEKTKEESLEWVKLLEGVIHHALRVCLNLYTTTLILL
jgi:metaxin